MGTWKKMAEAFGRARALNPNKNPTKGKVLKDGTIELTQKADSPLDDAQFSKSRWDRSVDEAFKAGTRAGQDIKRQAQIPPEARRIWENYDFDYERSYGPRDAYDRAVERARTSEADDLPASAEEFEDRYGFAVDGDLPDQAARRESAEDALTDERLKQNASDEWDEAFARRKQSVRDWYGKDYPEDMAEEGAEAFEKQLWELVDDLKAKGVSAQDILNRIKGND